MRVRLMPRRRAALATLPRVSRRARWMRKDSACSRLKDSSVTLWPREVRSARRVEAEVGGASMTNRVVTAALFLGTGARRGGGAADGGEDSSRSIKRVLRSARAFEDQAMHWRCGQSTKRDAECRCMCPMIEQDFFDDGRN